jgi:poly(3-hydroxybutyrate) depolymerase
MKTSIFALLLSSMASSTYAATAGCGKTPTLVSGNQTSMVNGQTRQWVLRIPEGYNNTNPYRLIIGLHWAGGSHTIVDQGGQGTLPYYGLPPLANNSAIFVAPNGLNQGWANQNGQDITFIDTMLATLEADLCIDEKLRFATGFSYGGGMSHSLACSRPKVIRAVGVLSGALLSGCQGGTDPVAYYIQHGINDTTLPIARGRQLRDTFVKNNGCGATEAAEPRAGSGTHIKTKYAGCNADYPLTWVAFDGGHAPQPRDTGATTSWVSSELWEFFSQFK